jgi:hypothetical protein
MRDFEIMVLAFFTCIVQREAGDLGELQHVAKTLPVTIRAPPRENAKRRHIWPARPYGAVNRLGSEVMDRPGVIANLNLDNDRITIGVMADASLAAD